ncbi:MAG: transcription termination factor NusA, partial [Gaiellaceae bacterium]
VAFGGGGDEQDLSGRCGAILANGKRCPNAALPGSRFCGVPAHQALALEDVPEDEEPIVAEDEPELEAEIAPPEAESIGIESLPEPEVAAKVEVELDAATHEVAPLEEVPAGIPVEVEESSE